MGIRKYRLENRRKQENCTYFTESVPDKYVLLYW